MNQLPRCGPAAARLALCLAGALAVAPRLGAQAPSVGLSSVRAQRFGNEDLFVFIPENGDRFAWSLATGDFNGDGADDLATGVPYDDGFGVVDSGLVIVRYGVRGSGLESGLADNALSQFFGGTPDPDEEGDRFGWALAACDFNDDGFDDLAVGIPYETYLGHAEAGAVQIHYGSPSGLPGAGGGFHTQSSPGVPGDVEEHDLFGYAVACGDFDADRFADLAVGVPAEDIGELAFGAGMVDIIPGSAAGLATANASSIDQDSSGMDGGIETADFFGSNLAVGDFDADGYADLAIGVRYEDFGNGRHGAVHTVYGGTSGLTSAGNFLFSESLFGGTPVHYDRFGDALAAGDFDGDGYDDLAVGIPFKDGPVDPPGTDRTDCGAFGEVFGSPSGLGASRSVLWFPDDVTGAFSCEANDRFGYALAAGDFDRDGRSDLAIGHPGEDSTVDYNGAATVMMGLPGFGLSADRHREFQEGLHGMPGPLNSPRRDFGFALAVGDFDGDGHDDLAIGAPWEEDLGLTDVGTQTVLYGALFADGFDSSLTERWIRVP